MTDQGAPLEPKKYDRTLTPIRCGNFLITRKDCLGEYLKHYYYVATLVRDRGRFSPSWSIRGIAIGQRGGVEWKVESPSAIKPE